MFESASPYLKLFSKNKINWHHCFTNELLKKAEDEDKLFFLHIGSFGNIYQREQSMQLFSDPEVISLLNDNFLCIVEDREDKPETFLMALDLLFLNDDFSGGPMSMIITPNQQPIICFSTTAPMDCRDTLNSILLAKKEKRERLMDMAKELSKRIAKTAIITNESDKYIDRNELTGMIKEWIAANHSDFMFWISPYRASPCKLLSQMACLKYADNIGTNQSHRLKSILRHYQYSALFDPISGGFFSHAKDATCKEALFEKALYINSSFLMLYTQASKILKEESYIKSAELIYHFITNELKYTLSNESGDNDDTGFGLCNSTTLTCKIEDADYYSYSMGEVMLLFPDKYEDISSGLTFQSNIGSKKRHTPIRTEKTYECIKERDLEILRERRKEHRNYYRDTRIMSEANFRAVKAIAMASELFDSYTMLEDAINIFDYVIKHNSRPSDGKLFRYSHSEKQYFSGNLSDYASLISASIELYRKRGEQKYLDIALKYTGMVYNKFLKPENGMFLKSEQNTSIEENCVPFRREFNIDIFKPSANSIMAGNLISLYEVTGREEFLRHAHRQISNIAPNIPESGPMLSNWIGEIVHFLSATE